MLDFCFDIDYDHIIICQSVDDRNICPVLSQADPLDTLTRPKHIFVALIQEGCNYNSCHARANFVLWYSRRIAPQQPSLLLFANWFTLSKMSAKEGVLSSYVSTMRIEREVVKYYAVE